VGSVVIVFLGNLSRRGRGLLALAVLIFAVGCSDTDNEQSPDAAETKSPEGYIPRLWVIGTARVHVLGQMFEVDQESVAVLGGSEYPFAEYGEQKWKTNIDFVLDSGLLRKVDGGYEVDTSLSPFEAGQNLLLGGDEMGGALGDTLRASPVTWCGEERNGDVLAQEYYEDHYGDFDSREEYAASIEEYVKCEAAQ